MAPVANTGTPPLHQPGSHIASRDEQRYFTYVGSMCVPSNSSSGFSVRWLEDDEAVSVSSESKKSR